MRERGTQSGGNGIVVVILEVVVVGVVLSEVLHREVHGCLCRWGETTRVYVVRIVPVVVVLVQKGHWDQRMPVCVHVPFVR